MLSMSTMTDLLKNSGVWIGVGFGVCFGFVLRWHIDSYKGTENTINTNKNKNKEEWDEEGFLANDFQQLKLVLVARSDLKMGKGKLAAQCCHATLKAYKQLKNSNPKLLHQWESSGQPKVVVKADNEEMLFHLADTARDLGLAVSIIQDAGRTQVAPGSRTVLGIGPGDVDLINAVTGHLKLL